MVYYRTTAEPDKVYASYIIVLPVSVDFAKYVPPFLTTHLGTTSMGDLSAFALPPVPEEVASHQELQHLADIRGDDLLYAGTMYSFDLPEMMQAVADVVREYSKAWSDFTKLSLNAGDAGSDPDQELSTVNEVLFSLMSELDRLAELSKLVGKLRFAIEGNDRQNSAEIEDEIKVLSRYMQEQFYIPSLLQAVMDSSVRGAQLAQLYLDRCYKISNGDDAGARELEQRIQTLKSSG